MAAVIGAARTLQDRWRMLSAAQRESFLALIGDETTRLAELVADVLDTSRIEAGTFSYRFDEVDLGRVVDEAVETAVLAQQDVPVVASVRGALPPIRGDRARLRQVLGNLIENAVKYSPEGGEVRVSAAASNGAGTDLRARHGPGIPRDQQARIFEKFGRGDVEGGSKPGSGLGLFIARSIAEAHGGSLDVSSGTEPGSTFTLSVPVGERRSPRRRIRSSVRVFRPFEERDTAAVDALLDSSWPDDPALREISAIHGEDLDDDGRWRRTLVSVSSGEIVGAGTLLGSARHPTRYFVVLLVAAEFRRRGIGSALLAALTFARRREAVTGSRPRDRRDGRRLPSLPRVRVADAEPGWRRRSARSARPGVGCRLARRGDDRCRPVALRASGRA